MKSNVITTIYLQTNRGLTEYIISKDKKNRFHAHEIGEPIKSIFNANISGPEKKAYKLNPMRRYKNRFRYGYSYPGLKTIIECKKLIYENARQIIAHY